MQSDEKRGSDIAQCSFNIKVQLPIPYSTGTQTEAGCSVKISKFGNVDLIMPYVAMNN